MHEPEEKPVNFPKLLDPQPVCVLTSDRGKSGV